jgi:hypothetical protein
MAGLFGGIEEVKSGKLPRHWLNNANGIDYPPCTGRFAVSIPTLYVTAEHVSALCIGPADVLLKFPVYVDI